MAQRNILVVDDEPASVRAVQRALSEEGRVVGVTSAAQGLTVLAAEPVALMIVDQRMPEMTGIEFLVATSAAYAEIIRVLLTGYTALDTLVDAINSGHVYYYLTKPWEPRELRLVVRRGLEHYEAEVERRRLLADLEQACRRIQREADQKRRLLALTSHELGTPLHVLANALALLAGTEVPPPARRWLQTAQRNAEWLGRGLQQVATAARWRSGRLPLRPQPLDVADLLAAVRAASHRVLLTRALTLDFAGSGDCALVFADRAWLERALWNLLSNAVRFTPDGGSIRVASDTTPTTVQIRVTDTGIGIDPALLDECFEPFSAVGGDIALHTSGLFEFGSRGLGLGLAIAKAVVEQHAGTISVRSSVHTGSQFTVTLPLYAPGVSAEQIR